MQLDLGATSSTLIIDIYIVCDWWKKTCESQFISPRRIELKLVLNCEQRTAKCQLVQFSAVKFSSVRRGDVNYP